MMGKTLVGRAPQIAALMGVVACAAPQARADFGSDDFGDDDFGSDDFGDDDFGDDDFGAGVAVQARGRALVGRKPTAQQAINVWNKGLAAHQKAQRRAAILNPNAGSALKVERYVFTLSHDITLGTAVSFSNFTAQPSVEIRPQRVTMNAPTVMFALIDDIKVGNVSVAVGTGQEDAFNYNPQGQGMSLDMPTISPATRATITGEYTGFVPPGFVGGTATKFSASFRGPAKIMG